MEGKDVIVRASEVLRDISASASEKRDALESVKDWARRLQPGEVIIPPNARVSRGKDGKMCVHFADGTQLMVEGQTAILECPLCHFHCPSCGAKEGK